MNPALLALAVQEAPAAIALLKDLFVKANPTAPVPTEAEIATAYFVALSSSLAKDDTYLNANPV